MQNAQSSGSGTPPGDGPTRDVGNATGIVTDAKNAASHVVEDLKAKAASAADEQKGSAAQALGTVASALRGAAEDLRQGEVAALGTYAENAAQQVEKVAGYLRDQDLKGLTRDTETFARRHPEVFLGGAFLAGLLAARFFKSSRPQPSATEPGFDPGFASGYAGASQSYAGGTQTEPFNPPHLESTGGQ
jgi:hypothetical protein